MLFGGLVSITFRKLTPREIAGWVAQSGLTGIEWGGDVHVPHGDLAQARHVAGLTSGAGLTVAAYGSYYRAGASEAAGLAFGRVLETAAALAAPTVRVWAGDRGSADADAADDSQRAAVVADLRRIAGLAEAAGVTVSLEFHRGTLTDTNESAARLLAEVAHPNLRAYWQPPVAAAPAYCLAGLRALLPALTHVHAFHWLAAAPAAAVERRPLVEGAAPWSQYLAEVAATGRDHFVLIEFVRDETPEQFLEDAQALQTWLRL
jgi:sugar phosphate isomerase/epimerase